MNLKISYILWQPDIFVTSPHRCCIMSYSQLKQISQSGQDKIFLLCFLSHWKRLWCSWHFYYFKARINSIFPYGKAPISNIHRDLFKTKHPKQNMVRPQAAFYMPYGVWIGLQPNWFSQMSQNVIFPKFPINTLKGI